ncbi:MAG: glycosyltransferase [Flavobacteriaceae bacterium]
MKSTNKPKVLILASGQFGYSTTTFKHCEFAADEFDITYIGWDYDLPKIELPTVNQIYVSRKYNKVMRNVKLLQSFHNEIRKGYDVVFVNYFRGSSLIKLANLKAKFMIYVDTLGVMSGPLKRRIYNSIMRFELFFFKNISMISEGIGKKIGLKEFKVLPLGGDCYATDQKTYEPLSLLYVGTLGGRRVQDCVKGFHQFLENSKATGANSNATFTIIGDSKDNDLSEIRTYVKANKLEKSIFTTGFLHRDKLAPYFAKSNVGVSYVPITPHYQHQPPTKTFEYLISGLHVIATATDANKAIVSKTAGVLINDTADSFQEGLLELWQRKPELDSIALRKEYAQYTWKRVVDEKFKPLVREALNA